MFQVLFNYRNFYILGNTMKIFSFAVQSENKLNVLFSKESYADFLIYKNILYTNFKILGTHNEKNKMFKNKKMNKKKIRCEQPVN